MDIKQEALQFVKRLQYLYFEKRDLSALIPAMDENTSWIGTGIQELCLNLEDAKDALSLDAQEYEGHFAVTQTKYDVRCLTEDICIVYGEITAQSDSFDFADVNNRLTAVCMRTQDGMKLVHLHMSTPDADQEIGRFYVKREDAEQRETLRCRAERVTAELRERNSQLEALTENIPGGVHQCECNDDMTFLSMSSSFLKLVGYSQEEISQRFDNCFANMIHPDDIARVQAEMAEQLSRGDSIELEYRILCGDGRVLWILDQGKRAMLTDGSQCFYCMLMDTTNQKQEREEFRLSLERHQIIMDQTTDIIFEWDIAKDVLTFSSNWNKKFGYEPIRERISSEIPHSLNIHPVDMAAFVKIMKDAAAGMPYAETEFRIRDILGNFKWNRIRATVQYDSLHRPVKAVGVILDIDADKKQKERLLEKAQRDPLTNLYNKTALRDLAKQKIAESVEATNQALLIIDVDRFKSVNDTYGHLCGDSLLSDIARVLKSQFRSSDIVGRIGGDEFLVYMSEITGKKAVEEKAQSLLEALRQLRPVEDAPTISCSIGAAILSQQDVDYFTLYKCADQALYQIKANGKNNVAFFDPDVCDGQLVCNISDSAVGAIDSEMEYDNAVSDKVLRQAGRMPDEAGDI